MRALVYQPHGIGDNIMLTPCLRKLYNDGYRVTLMCHPEILKSHLFDSCEYISDFCIVPNPWKTKLGKNLPAMNRHIYNSNLELFEKKRKDYDWSGKALHNDRQPDEHKIYMTARELGIEIDSPKLEVFIPDWIKEKVNKNQWITGDFVFMHDVVNDHPYHNWPEAEEWMDDNLGLQSNVFRVSQSGNYFCDNINYAFEILRRAKHRILCSSVFVHAAEALDLTIDCLYHGNMDEKVIPLNKEKVRTFIYGGEVIWKH